VTDPAPTPGGPGDLDIGAFETHGGAPAVRGRGRRRLAATTITDEELEDMEAIITEMSIEKCAQAKRRKSPTVVSRCHRAGHRNTAITAVIENLWICGTSRAVPSIMLERRGASAYSADQRASAYPGGAAKTTIRRRAQSDARPLHGSIEGLWRLPRPMPSRARSKAVKKRHEYTRRLAV